MKFLLTVLGAATLIAAMVVSLAHAQQAPGHLPLTDAEVYPPDGPQDLTMQEYLEQRP